MIFSLYLHVSVLYVCRSEEAREGIISSEAGGVIGSCKLSNVVLETKLRTSTVTFLTTEPSGQALYGTHCEF